MSTAILLLALFILLSPSGGVAAETSTSDPCGGGASAGVCPVRCFRADPVCGEDGVTYWCGCADAACHGARVAMAGPCAAAAAAAAGGQVLLLVHTVWLFVLGLSLACGLL